MNMTHPQTMRTFRNKVTDILYKVIRGYPNSSPYNDSIDIEEAVDQICSLILEDVVGKNEKTGKPYFEKYDIGGRFVNYLEENIRNHFRALQRSIINQKEERK